MIDLRSACAGDSERLADIGIRAWESAVPHWGEDTEKLRDHAHRAYRDFCADQWQTILVAQNGAAVVGWGARENMDHYISDLWVDPQYQGRGVGKRLLAALERTIAEAGFADVELETHARNTPTIGFYEAAGYRVVSRFIKYEPSLRKDIEKLSMRKTLRKPSAEHREP